MVFNFSFADICLGEEDHQGSAGGEEASRRISIDFPPAARSVPEWGGAGRVLEDKKTVGRGVWLAGGLYTTSQSGVNLRHLRQSIHSGGPRILAKGVPHLNFSMPIHYIFFLNYKAEEMKIVRHDKMIK
jgi:hypothetical protein